MREINAFYDWLATNPISDSARNLWHALMHTANRAGWITEFAVALSVLEAKTGMSRSAIYRARNILKESGRITFRNQKGNLASIYEIIPFVSQIDTQSGTHTDTRAEHTPQHEWNTNREHNTSYPTDTQETKSKTKKKTNTDARKVESKPEKINFAEFVSMTQQERDKLSGELGESGASRCIEILNNYKGSSGKKYASDYMAIRNWVIDRYRQETKSPKSDGGPPSKAEQFRILAERMERSNGP